jgi:hypothetical protein
MYKSSSAVLIGQVFAFHPLVVTLSSETVTRTWHSPALWACYLTDTRLPMYEVETRVALILGGHCHLFSASEPLTPCWLQ